MATAEGVAIGDAMDPGDKGWPGDATDSGRPGDQIDPGDKGWPGDATNKGWLGD